ncbi:MAG TPA: stage 0 sporulation family protein [Ktedonobacteraceae bacterium]|nr:stage 0 sporulation family protein [Ktedonobacteraceae bacterium]
MPPTVSASDVVVTIVGIRFRPAGRIYYFDPQGQAFATGQYVIVETVRGVEAGRVVIAPKTIPERELSDPLKPVLRLASEDELRMMLSFKGKEKDALAQCDRQVKQHKLPMKLVEAEYTFDGSRLTFYFIAEERVDFRALVRDLAATFRTRIELRQIGARDQAKLQGGVGICGKTLCCSSWITDFGVVSIKMAKEQDLPLNPAKISGVCGRLLCCLAYENDTYARAKQTMPPVGSFMDTPSGSGKVVSINVPRSSVEVMLESGVIIQVPVSDSAAGGCGSCSKAGACGIQAAKMAMPASSETRSGCGNPNCTGACSSGGACTCGTGAKTDTENTSAVSTAAGRGSGACGIKRNATPRTLDETYRSR